MKFKITTNIVEKMIEKHSGEFIKREIWKALPKKVTWQTYNIILKYLKSINKIGSSKLGRLTYIWNPKAAKYFMSLNRKSL